MRLKRSEKCLLAATLLLVMVAVGLHVVRSGQQEAFYIEENFSLSRRDTQQGEEKININTATAQELQQLEGIGPALAEKIIAYRQANGDFKRIEDIAFVSGIGSEKYDAICDKITVE